MTAMLERESYSQVSFCVCMKDTNSDDLVNSVLPTSGAKIWGRCFESW